MWMSVSSLHTCDKYTVSSEILLDSVGLELLCLFMIVGLVCGSRLF